MFKSKFIKKTAKAMGACARKKKKRFMDIVLLKSAGYLSQSEDMAMQPERSLRKFRLQTL